MTSFQHIIDVLLSLFKNVKFPESFLYSPAVFLNIQINRIAITCFVSGPRRSLHPSDNIPNDALPGNESQYGIQSIPEPHGPRHGLDA